MTSKKYNYIDIENKWQQKWFQNKIYESSKDKNKKFFIHFAYPGVSGYLHVGHMRGFTYCDIIARQKRMTGHDVLFPAGFHASGIPSIGFAKKVERQDPQTLNILKEYGLNKKEIKKLKDPKEVVNYFSNVYVEDYWKKFGFLIDYSRIMSTISPGYKKFIKWQFHKLNQTDLLTQKPHYAPFCPNCGPVAVDKSETDISKGGTAQIQEFTTIKFKMDDGTILPAATLRPETIFGVTNMWVNPDIEYIKADINDETWILSPQAYNKIKHQFDNLKPSDEKVKGEELINKKCTIPLIDREIPILSGPFADPNVATGIVMSVPAHAPYDWIALIDADVDIEPIKIIDSKDLGSNPAKEVVEELGIQNQHEQEKLEKATEIVYKKEFHKGHLNENCGEYAGINVSDIKDQVKDDLIEKNHATIMREFSEEVICRCGEKVVIKKIPDQWFIKYSDHDLTDKTKNHVKKMDIYPNEYKEQLPKVLEWFEDRACIRKGSWLGTEFPYKKGWIVEPISDSTLYPAYYIISKFVNENKIKPEEMTEQFFDYVFLNKGTPKSDIWKEIKKEFDYWYPVDINLGGKEHKTVHFPVFLMNHVAIMPEKKHPKGIFVHWWVTQKGKEKISKSKGGAEHIADAARKYGVDAMRLYYSHVGSPFIDVEWDSEKVTKYKNRLANIYKLLSKEETSDSQNEQIDRWLLSILNRKIQKIKQAFEKYDLREASNEIFFELQKDLQWYLKRGGSNQEVLQNFKNTWIKLMTPITPHLAEEIWHQKNSNFVSDEQYPKCNPDKINAESEAGEHLLGKVLGDIKEILKVTKIDPDKICIYTTSQWKQKVVQTAIELQDRQKVDMSTLMKELMEKPEMKKHAKKVSKYASKIIKEIKKLNKQDIERYTANLNEERYLENAKSYIENQFSCQVEIFSGDKEDIYDPENKSDYATPLKPGIYIE
ncbi:MAG: leucine--tRNA ligase [Candidatus Thermoplasmatota archaeon]